MFHKTNVACCVSQQESTKRLFCYLLRDAAGYIQFPDLRFRPKRPDPMDASGLSDYYEKKRKNSQDPDDSLFLDLIEDETGKETKCHREIHEICDKMECEAGR